MTEAQREAQREAQQASLGVPRLVMWGAGHNRGQSAPQEEVIVYCGAAGREERPAGTNKAANRGLARSCGKLCLHLTRLRCCSFLPPPVATGTGCLVPQTRNKQPVDSSSLACGIG